MLRFECIREGFFFVLESHIEAGSWLTVYKKVTHDSALFRNTTIYLKPDTKIRIVYLPA